MEGGLKGHALKPFTSKCAKALEFLSDFNIYWMYNNNNVAMRVPYQRIAIFLGFLEGDKLREWKDEQIQVLQEEVQTRTACKDEGLWDNFRGAFIWSFMDTTIKGR